ncbi:PilZ domain-containing protein [Methylopila musalis]|uniref:PilZ domain-containing protein n=1 Tax=Methylopila musalis TaxID=1134781 RepID=A0ABW3Z7L0_9HYPH
MQPLDLTPPLDAGADQRDAAIPGRCMLMNGQEFACEALRVSLHMAVIIAAPPMTPDARVICYLNDIGILRGWVDRLIPHGFVLRLDVREDRRARLAASLEWHSNRAALAEAQRIAPRIVPIERKVEMRLGEALVFPGLILDLSVSGAAILMKPAHIPFVGSVVRAGRRPATVVRAFDKGVGVQFREPIPSAAFSEHIVL